MNDEHKTHDAQVFSQMDNADQVNARENKNGAAATTTATPDDEHPKDSTFRELSKDDTRYILYHMDPKEWDGMSSDQRKALLETLHPADKRALASFNLRPDDLAVMPLQTARGVLRASIINVANGIVNKTVYPDLPPEVKADSKELEIVLGREVAKLLHDPEYSARLDLLVKYHQGYRELEPFLKKAVKGKDFQGRTLDDIVTDSVQNHNDVLGPGMDMDDPTTELGRLFAAARKMAAENITVTVKKTKKQKYPVDKYNRMFWNGIIDGNTKSGFDMKPPMGAIVMYRVNFDDLPDNVNFSKDITPFDKQVYTTAGSILWAGNQITTITQIYYQMGYRGKPAKKTLERIHESIEKMRFTHLWIDNDEETGKLKKRTHYHYDGYLLPAEIVTATVNGKLTDEAIHFLKPDLPLMAFAAERGEITTITTELRQLPISMTENNLALHDELYTRLSIEKNRKKKDKQCRMLLDTIYENMGLTADQKVQRSRVKKNIIALLDHYKINQFISRYVFENDGITIYWK